MRKNLAITRRPGVIVFALTCLLAACAATAPKPLPPDGRESWEIRDTQEIVTFALFDPVASRIDLPHGLRFLRAGEVQIPFVVELVKERPEYSGWAFSFFEFTQQAAFVIDGRSPTLPKDGAIALWFAPVDASELAAAISGEPLARAIQGAGGAVVGLGVWMQDREYVDYMRTIGHYAEYAETTLSQDGASGLRGTLRLSDLSVRASARIEGEPETEPGSDTQVLFSPHAGPSRAVVISTSDPSHQTCSAEWELSGSHPLGRAIVFGPTFRTTYPSALLGRAFAIGGRD